MFTLNRLASSSLFKYLLNLKFQPFFIAVGEQFENMQQLKFINFSIVCEFIYMNTIEKLFIKFTAKNKKIYRFSASSTVYINSQATLLPINILLIL